MKTNKGPIHAGAGSVAAWLLLAAGPLMAADYTVTNGDDSGAGSLREAIETANTTPEADTVSFDASVSNVTLTRTILVTEPITLQGPGASGLTITADADATDILRVDGRAAGVNGIDVTVADLTMVTAAGRTVRQLRAISTNLAVRDVRMIGNEVEKPAASGGALVLQNSNLVMQDTVVQDFVTEFRGAALYVVNDNQSTVRIERCAFLNNLVADGPSTAYPKDGGAIFVETPAAGPSSTRLEIVDTELSGNEGQNGGAIAVRNSVALSLQNSTISANVARSAGGGLFGSRDAGSVFKPAMYLETSTITDNDAAQAGGIALAPFNGTVNSHGLLISNTIIAGNRGTLASAPVHDGYAIEEVVASYSLIGDDAGDAVGLIVVEHQSAIGSVMIDTDPMLGPLADNGGPTWTHALQSGSPLVDAGSNTASPHDNSMSRPATDQRGNARVSGSGMDIGAYERTQGGGGNGGNGGGNGGGGSGGGSTGPGLLVLLALAGLRRRRAC